MRIFTQNGTRYLGQRQIFGSLEAGMKTDFIIVERSPFKVSAI